MKKKKRYNGKRKKFHSFRFITILLAILVGFELVAGGVGLIGLQSFLSDCRNPRSSLTPTGLSSLTSAPSCVRTSNIQIFRKH